MEFISKKALDEAFMLLIDRYKEAEDSTAESPKYVSENGRMLLFEHKGYTGVLSWFRENYKEDDEIQKVLDEGVKTVTREEKNEQISAALVNGVNETITEGENYKNWLKCCSKFPKYSFNNTMLIHIQKPDASHVCGYQQWINDFERHVKKGEKGITIYAPVFIKKKFNQPVEDASGHYIQNADGTIKTEEITKQYTSFKAISVFDVSQTEGKELPSICKELEGDVKDFDELIKAAKAASPAPIEMVDGAELNGAKGCYIPSKRVINVAKDMSEMQTFKTLTHEIAHARLGHGESDCNLSRQEKELQAESVAFIVCANLGIDTSDYSFEYLSSWSMGETDQMMDLMADIQSTANSIVKDISLNRSPELRMEYYENLWDNRSDKPLIAIFQLPDDHDFAFMSYEDMVDGGYMPSIGDFELKYVEEDKLDKDLEQIYMELNSDERPNADSMRSLSVGDVVIKHVDSEDNVFMVDAYGFSRVEGFEENRSLGRAR